MVDTFVNNQVLNGGSFIVQDSTIETTFIPEELGEEALMVKSMIEDFIKNDVEPNRVALEKQKEGVAIGLLEKMGDLGLLGTHMPEIYGGTAMDTNTNTMICDSLGPAGGFTVYMPFKRALGCCRFCILVRKNKKPNICPNSLAANSNAPIV